MFRVSRLDVSTEEWEAISWVLELGDCYELAV